MECGWFIVVEVSQRPHFSKEVRYCQARSQDLEKGGGGYFERVRSVQTTLTGIFIDLEAVSDGLSEN